MLLSDDDEQKRDWNENGHSLNGRSHKADDAYAVSLLSSDSETKPSAASAAVPLSLSHSTAQPHSLQAASVSYSHSSLSTTALPAAPSSAIPPVHRPFLFLLCFCSFFVTFRPSEPFLTPYLIEYKGLGADAVNERVYPTWTYCYFAFLLPAGVLGEVVGYRPMIAAQLMALLATYVVLIWAEGLAWMQFMQATYGFASAVQSCVFFTYVYRCSPVECYPTVVAATRRHAQYETRPHCAARTAQAEPVVTRCSSNSQSRPLYCVHCVRPLTNELRVSADTVSCCTLPLTSSPPLLVSGVVH